LNLEGKKDKNFDLIIKSPNKNRNNINLLFYYS